VLLLLRVLAWTPPPTGPATQTGVERHRQNQRSCRMTRRHRRYRTPARWMPGRTSGVPLAPPGRSMTRSWPVVSRVTWQRFAASFDPPMARRTAQRHLAAHSANGQRPPGPGGPGGPVDH
jgi:hypothetical protein